MTAYISPEFNSRFLNKQLLLYLKDDELYIETRNCGKSSKSKIFTDKDLLVFVERDNKPEELQIKDDVNLTLTVIRVFKAIENKDRLELVNQFNALNNQESKYIKYPIETQLEFLNKISDGTYLGGRICSNGFIYICKK